MSVEVLWMQSADPLVVVETPARVDRQLFDSLFTEGVVDYAATGLLASAHADLWKVSVAVGRAVIDGDDQADQGKYVVTVNAVEVVTLNPPPGADKRIDIVYLQVRDPQAGGAAGYDGRVYFAEGATHATAPVAPATPASAIVLAQVTRTAGDAALAAGMFADQRFEVAPFDGLLLEAVVRLATIAALAASTITGLDRVADAVGALATIDSVAPAVGDRILDKDHATGASRGIWRITDIGSAARKWRMTRSIDADASAKVRDGLWVRVREGTTLAGTGWMLTTNDPIVLDTTALVFAQFPAASSGSSPASDSATVAAVESTTSTTFAGLTTPLAVTVTTGTKAWVTVGCRMDNLTAATRCFAGFAVSGATTRAAADADALAFISETAGEEFQGSWTGLIEGLTAGANVFTAQYRVFAGTGDFEGRRISVADAGS